MKTVRMTARTFRRITWPAPLRRNGSRSGRRIGTRTPESICSRPAAWAASPPPPAQRSGELDDGRRLDYGALLLATGASPIRLDVPGAQLPHVHYLRSLSDSRTIIERATRARRAGIVGASFIGLELAASLRSRDLDVHVVAPEEIPMQRVLGAELGRFVREVHEQHGVQFHLGQ